jgi:nicotinate-nucleotide pyrophosphorylase (carboxylating)
MNENSTLGTLIDLALSEDLGEQGDITSKSFIPENSHSSGKIIVKEDCVIAGSEIAEQVFNKFDPSIKIDVLLKSGSSAQCDTTVINLSGKTRSILSAERTALNFIQRLSGIATLTKKYVDAVNGTNAKILDTRKTTPGWRRIEKLAVLSGGGSNHRMGLFDMAMLKDNHLANESDPELLQKNIHSFKDKYPNARIELEADNLKQVIQFVKMDGVDVILLDNMSENDLIEAVKYRSGSIQFEASGGINLESVHNVAKTGVDFISVGALTHSASSVDFSLELDS